MSEAQDGFVVGSEQYSDYEEEVDQRNKSQQQLPSKSQSPAMHAQPHKHAHSERSDSRQRAPRQEARVAPASSTSSVVTVQKQKPWLLVVRNLPPDTTAALLVAVSVLSHVMLCCVWLLQCQLSFSGLGTVITCEFNGYCVSIREGC